MTGQQISHYRIEEPLGRGGMGIVYAAEDLRLGRKVAIKFLPDEACCEPEAVERFLREARAISALNHPHICTLHDIGEHQGQQFMVMELLEGEPLKARLARGPLPLDDVLDYGEQMADALDAAHAKGIVHRDLKPANLFLTHRGQIKVLDFGVAKLTGPGREAAAAETIAGSDQLTTLGSAVGTIQYMSPEQARGQEIDGRSDLFSLGIVLYEMATGRAPFAGVTPAVVFEGILAGTPVPPSQLRAGVPEDFDRLVFRALEKDREMRYQSAADLRAELRRLRKATDSGRTLATGVIAGAGGPTGLPSTSAPPGPAGGSSASVAAPGASASSAVLSRSRTVWWAAGLLVTIGVVGGVLLWRSTSTPALADRDLVVLADFVNRTGDAMFDDTLSEALGVQLRQSPFLNVLNEQQQASTLRLMGRDPMTPITSEVGRELCQRAGARALLGGSIAGLGTAYLVTLSAEDCVTGEVLAEQQVQADGKEGVLGALSGGVRRFREQLGESLASIQRYDAPVEMATTSSLDALKAYSQGMVARRMKGDFEAVPFLERAIELDPEFALAYARLGTVYSNMGDLEKARRATEKAFELRERVSDRERSYIEGRYHTTVTRDLDKAITSYQLLLATYPDDYAARVNLGLLLYQQARLSEAIPMLEAAVRAGPDQPLAYLNLGSALVAAERYADARKAFEDGLQLQESTTAREGLFVVATLTGDAALALTQVAAVRGRRDEVEMTGLRVQAALYQGRLAEARTLSDEWMGAMMRENRTAAIGPPAMGGVIAQASFGLTAEAQRWFAELQKAGHLSPDTADEELAYAALTRDAALARRALPVAIKAQGDAPDLADRRRAFEAMVALAENRPADAAAMLDPPVLTPARAQLTLVWAVACSRAGRHADAATGFGFMLSPGSQLGLDPQKPWMMVSYARALAAAGRAADARTVYDEFFELWKFADADVPLLVQAREEVAKLGT